MRLICKQNTTVSVTTVAEPVRSKKRKSCNCSEYVCCEACVHTVDCSQDAHCRIVKFFCNAHFISLSIRPT